MLTKYVKVYIYNLEFCGLKYLLFPVKYLDKRYKIEIEEWKVKYRETKMGKESIERLNVDFKNQILEQENNIGKTDQMNCCTTRARTPEPR